MKKATRNVCVRVAEAICGLIVAAGAGIAWHLWHVDGFLAAMIALGGLGMVGHAFWYEG